MSLSLFLMEIKEEEVLFHRETVWEDLMMQSLQMCWKDKEEEEEWGCHVISHGHGFVFAFVQ